MELEDQQNIPKLTLALNIANITGNTADSFWHALAQVEDMLCSSAMMAVTMIYDFDEILPSPNASLGKLNP